MAANGGRRSRLNRPNWEKSSSLLPSPQRNPGSREAASTIGARVRTGRTANMSAATRSGYRVGHLLQHLLHPTAARLHTLHPVLRLTGCPDPAPTGNHTGQGGIAAVWATQRALPANLSAARWRGPVIIQLRCRGTQFDHPRRYRRLVTMRGRPAAAFSGRNPLFGSAQSWH